MRRVVLLLGCAVVTALAWSGTAFAWPAGIDSIETMHWRMKTGLEGAEKPRTCRPCGYSDYTLEFAGYFVHAIQLRTAVGESLLVTRKTSKTMSWTRRSRVDLTINEDMGHFLGLQGDYLFVDATSCPCPSGLIIYDLATGKRIFEATRVDVPSEPVIQDGRWLIYQEDLGEPEWDCPEAASWKDSFGTGFEEEVWLDLTTLKKTRTGKITCSARQ